jgi:ribosome maturation factor RimP
MTVRSSFRQGDVTRLIKAVTAAGCDVFEVQFDTEQGLIRIITDREHKPKRKSTGIMDRLYGPNSLDRLLDES